MNDTNQRTKTAVVKKLLLFSAFFILFVSGTVFCLAVPSTQIAGGLSDPRAMVLDEANNHLYFIEYSPGNLKRVDLSDPAHPVTTITAGLPQPTGLALDPDRDLAYVTTVNNPGQPMFSGALWKVVISTGIRTLITFNLARPMQLVLNQAKTHAYTVGYDDGRLRRIELATGIKIPVYKHLQKPMGIVITGDEKYAYVSQHGPPDRAIVKIDLTMGSLLGTITASFSSPPAFLAWADAGESALYVAERGGPADRKVSRVDLTTNTKNVAIPGTDLPGQPAAMAVKGVGTPVYVSMHGAIGEIREYDLLDLSGPVFMAVGHVPSSAITPEGYADTVNLMPGYFYQVQHCPFGGTMNIFGNFTNFLASAPAAVYYAVFKTKGASTTPLSHTWTVSRWDSTVNKHKPFTMAPALDGFKYEIPVESDGAYHADLWWYPFWIMRWPSGENGEYTFEIKLYDSTGSEIAPLPAGFNTNNSLTLLVDNTLPQANIDEIWQKKPPGPDHLVEACEIVEDPANEFYFKLTAYDSNQHLLYYNLRALWGNNKSANVYSDSYSSHVGGPPNYPWSGIFKQLVLQTSPWPAACNCAHTFYLRVTKRTINGYDYIRHKHWHKSITINNTGNVCN